MAFLDVGFAKTVWLVIEASEFVSNDASVRVLNKLGFQEVRHAPAVCRTQGWGIGRVDFAIMRVD